MAKVVITSYVRKDKDGKPLAETRYQSIGSLRLSKFGPLNQAGMFGSVSVRSKGSVEGEFVENLQANPVLVIGDKLRLIPAKNRDKDGNPTQFYLQVQVS